LEQNGPKLLDQNTYMRTALILFLALLVSGCYTILPSEAPYLTRPVYESTAVRIYVTSQWGYSYYVPYQYSRPYYSSQHYYTPPRRPVAVRHNRPRPTNDGRAPVVRTPTRDSRSRGTVRGAPRSTTRGTLTPRRGTQTPSVRTTPTTTQTRGRTRTRTVKPKTNT
jgi:uncharacterized protein YceK